MTYRRFGVLLMRLPRESLFMQATLGESVRWSDMEHMLAHLIDGVRTLNHNYVQSHRKSRLPKLQPFPRPGVEDKSKPVVLGRGGGIPVADMRKRIDARRGGDGDGRS